MADVGKQHLYDGNEAADRLVFHHQYALGSGRHLAGNGSGHRHCWSASSLALQNGRLETSKDLAGHIKSSNWKHQKFQKVPGQDSCLGRVRIIMGKSIYPSINQSTNIYVWLRRKPREQSETRNTVSAEPRIQGIKATPARSGPNCPIKLPPTQAPMTPTIADVRNP